MAVKNVKYPTSVVSAQDMSTSFNTPSSTVIFYDRVSYAATWTGAPSGSLIVQGSADGTHFSDLDMQPATMSGLGDSAQFDIIDTGFYALRLSYTALSGTGSLSAVVTFKSSGG